MFAKKRLRRGGFTLLEIIIAMVVFFIILIGVLTAFTPGFRFFGAVDQLSSAKSISGTVYAYIEDKVRYATSMTIGADTTQEQVLQVVGGQLEYNGTEVFSKAFYTNMSLEVTYSKKTDQALLVTIVLKDDKGDTVHTKDSTIELKNLQLAKTLGKTDPAATKIATGSDNSQISFSQKPPV